MSELTEKERKTILAKVLVKMDTAYGKGLSENTDKIQQWFHAIGHLNEEAALETADACIENHRWQPTIAEFLELSRTVRRNQEERNREAPKPISPQMKEAQERGLKVQRALIEARTLPSRRHDHTSGWQVCPICAQASAEEDADECRTCMILEDKGLTVAHHKA